MATYTCETLDLPCHWDSLTHKLQNTLLYLYDSVLQGIASTFHAVPIPSAFNNSGNMATNIAADIWYFVYPFELGYGITAIIGSLTARFLLRRLPFIG